MCRSASLALRHCPPFASSAIRNMRFRKAVAATSRCGLSSLRAKGCRAQALAFCFHSCKEVALAIWFTLQYAASLLIHCCLRELLPVYMRHALHTHEWP